MPGPSGGGGGYQFQITLDGSQVMQELSKLASGVQGFNQSITAAAQTQAKAAASFNAGETRRNNASIKAAATQQQTQITAQTQQQVRAAVIARRTIVSQAQARERVLQTNHDLLLQRQAQRHADTLEQISTRAATKTSGSGGTAGKILGGFGLPQRSAGVNKAILESTSAVRGMIIGMDAASLSGRRLLQDLTRLRFTMIPLALSVAAVTAALSAYEKITKKAIAAGRALQDQGQQLASFFRSAAKAQEIMTQADEISRKFGENSNEIAGMLGDLEKYGLRSNTYIKGILDTAAANGAKVSEVGTRFTDILRADSSSRADLIKKFAQDFDLPVKTYANTLELAKAMNDRFYGAEEAKAQTLSGTIARLRATGTSFLQVFGQVINAFLVSFIEPVISFFDGMISGFESAKEAANKTGDLTQQIKDLKFAIEQILPYFEAVGRLVGRVLFNAFMAAAHALKVFVDVIQYSLKFIKEHRDLFQSAGQSFKKNFLDEITGTRVETNIKAAIGFLEGFFATVAKGIGGPKITAEDILPALDEGETRGLAESIFGGLKSLPKAFFVGIFEGLKQGLIFGLIEALALTALDLLPISDNWKMRLNGVVRMSFTGAAIGSIFGPVGTLIGAALGLAVGGALDAIQPGLATKVMNWIDDTMTSAFKALGAFITDKAIPAFQSFGKWIDDEGIPKTKNFAQKINDAVLPVIKDWADKTSDYLGPKLASTWSWIQTTGIPVSMHFASVMGDAIVRGAKAAWSFFDQYFMPTLSHIWSFLTESLVPLLESIGRVTLAAFKLAWELTLPTIQAIVTVATDLWNFFKDHLLPIVEDIVLIGINPLKNAVLDLKGLFDDLLTAAQWLTDKALIPFLNNALIPLFNKMNDDVVPKFLDFLNIVITPIYDFIKDKIGPMVVWFTDQVLKPLADKLVEFSNLSAYDLIVGGFQKIESALWWVWKRADDAYNKIKDVVTLGGAIPAVVGVFTPSSGPHLGDPGTPVPGMPGYIYDANGSPIPASGGGSSGLGFTFGGQVPEFPRGGTVSGTRGTRHMVMAEAGEMFLGAPELQHARPMLSANGIGGLGGSNINITIPVYDSVVVGDMADLADKLAGKIIGRLSNVKKVSLHRV